MTAARARVWQRTQEVMIMAAHTTEQLLAEVEKNDREVIRVQRTSFKGIDLVDARVWTVPAIPGAESKPTKKGLTLRPETWAELTAALRQALLDRFTFRRLILLFGVLRDKDYRGILRKVAAVADTVILTSPGGTDRAKPPGELAEEARRHGAEVLVVEDPGEALRKALRMAGAGDVVCATGSLYLVGTVKKAYRRVERLQETMSLS